MSIKKVAVIGGGAWGTALGQTLRLAGKSVSIWAYEPETVEDINLRHVNRTYLPGISLDPELKASSNLSTVITSTDVVLLVTPAQHVRTLANKIAPLLHKAQPVVLCSKGFETFSGKLLGQVLSEILPNQILAVLSGPSFASDVAKGLPAALTIGCLSEDMGRSLAEGLGYRQLRIYWSSDTVGVETGGALKNVLAIAAGIVEAKGLGASAHAGIVTRGFAEMRRLAEKLGARTNTIMGLSGLGDLILTCGSSQSRNMSLGRELGMGKTLAEILHTRTSVAEGIYTAEAAVKIAKSKNIEIPICEAVHSIINGTQTVNDAISNLMNRPFKAED